MGTITLLFRHPTGTAPPFDTLVDTLNAAFERVPITFSTNAAAARTDARLARVDVGGCDDAPTAMAVGHEDLFALETPGEGEALVFLADQVISSNGGTTGCARHPPDRPGVVVLTDANRWVLAHEMGHLLGLGHAATSRELMTANPSTLDELSTPDIAAGDLACLRASSVPLWLAPVFETTVATPRRRRRRTVRPTRKVAARRGGRRAANRTEAVASLVHDALGTLRRRRTPQAIDAVACAIDGDPRLRRRYRALVRAHGVPVVHREIGRQVRASTGMVSSGRYARGSSFMRRYAVLQPARPVARRRKR